MGFFSKKQAAAEEDPNRNSLFGDRKSQNPPPPYSQTPPPANNNSYGSKGNAQGGYEAPLGSNYGGYGASSASSSSGGYGRGLNRNNSSDTVDSNRDNLFGGAGQRVAQQQRPQQGQAPGGYGSQGGYGAPPSGYNPDRQLTAEEEEEEDVNAVKQQIRFTKQQSVASTRNAIRVAAQAEEIGRNTLARLGTQGESLYNTEKNLDLAMNHNRNAEAKAKELKTLNRSMFAVHVKNPLNSSSRNEQEERRIIARHEEEREEREKTRQFGYESRARIGSVLNEKPATAAARAQLSLAERSKYQFEGDESDDEKEKEIHQNLDQLYSITGRLKNLAMATSQEVDRQNEKISDIMAKSDKVDIGIAITHNKLKKIN
ncbi:Protein transport protein S9 plasma membrane t-SNARE [Rhizina undulata]